MPPALPPSPLTQGYYGAGLLWAKSLPGVNSHMLGQGCG